MSVPGVKIAKVDGGVPATGDDTKVLQVLGPALSGPLNTPTVVTRPADLTSIFGTRGVLVEAAAYLLALGITLVCTRTAATTEGTYTAVVKTGGGTSVVTTGAAKPADTYDFKLEILSGGTIGVAGIVYRYAYDGANKNPSWSQPEQLGTNTTVTLPGNVQVNFGAGTVVAGNTFAFTTGAPVSTNADLGPALDAVYEYKGPWLRALLTTPADATITSAVDLWLKKFHPQGKRPEFLLNVRPRDLATPETRAAYQAAMAAIIGQVQSTEVLLGYDQGELASTLAGVRLRKPSVLATAARLMTIDDSQDSMAPADGALPGWFLQTVDGASPYHDELFYPGPDDLGFTAHRTWRSRPGVYINNARVIAGAASSYRRFDISAIVNRAIEDAFPLLENFLGRGIRLLPGGKANPQDLVAIEEVVNAVLRTKYVETRRVSDLRCVLSRVDDVQGTDTISFSLPVQPLGSPHFFDGKAGAVRAVVIPAAA